MSNFEITFNHAVSGYWGFYIPIALGVLALLILITAFVMHKNHGGYDDKTQGFYIGAVVLAFLTAFGCIGAFGTYGDLEASTLADRRNEALVAAGYPLMIFQDEGIALKDDEGNMALYTSVSTTRGDETTMTFYQISE